MSFAGRRLQILREDLRTPMVIYFWVLQNCVTKRVSTRFYDDPLVKQLRINFIKFVTSFNR